MPTLQELLQKADSYKQNILCPTTGKGRIEIS